MFPLEKLLAMSNRELVQFAASYNMTLTEKQIQKLRPILQQANISWLLFGIPSDEQRAIAQIIGRDNLKKLEQLLHEKRLP